MYIAIDCNPLPVVFVAMDRETLIVSPQNLPGLERWTRRKRPVSAGTLLVYGLSLILSRHDKGHSRRSSHCHTGRAEQIEPPSAIRQHIP